MKRAMDRHTAETFSSDSPHFVRPLNTHPNAGKPKAKVQLGYDAKSKLQGWALSGDQLMQKRYQ